MAAAIIAFMGSGKTGLEIRKKFAASPFGWPQDAIDAVWTTLLASNQLSAHSNGNPLSLTEVDQKKLGQAGTHPLPWPPPLRISPPWSPTPAMIFSWNETISGALLAKIKTWPSTGKKITNRLPAFVLTEKLVAQAVGLAEQAEWSATLIARRANRSLVLEAGCRTVVGKIFGGIGWLRELVTHKFVAHPPPSALRAGLAGTALFRPAPK